MDNQFTWLIVLAEGSQVKISAEWSNVDYGAIVFYKKGTKTIEDNYPEPIIVQAFAVGTWLSVTKLPDLVKAVENASNVIESDS